jgi:hypothetical protein
MLKDIKDPISEGVTIAAIYELSEDQEMVWNIYLLNYKETPIESVLITSKGYGEQDGEEIRTSILRHFVKEMPPLSAARVEPIQEDVFPLINEYFITYYQANILFERKFTFESYSISVKNTQLITFIGQQGIEIV